MLKIYTCEINSTELQIISHVIPNDRHHVDVKGLCTLCNTLECLSESHRASPGATEPEKVICGSVS